MKKKLLMSLTAFFALCGGASAQQVAVAGVEALPVETVSLALQLDTDGGSYTGMEFDILFPGTGFTTTGKATTTMEWDGSFTIGDVGALVDNTARCGVLSYSDTPIPGTGLQQVGTVEFTVGSGIALGDYTVTLTNMTLIGDARVPVADATFTLSVVDVHTVVLDENSATAPADATGINVSVKRTIKGGEWSTICLPFAMTEEQVKAAFGDNVQLGDFSSWSSEEDDDGNIATLEIVFTDVSEMEANHPYIIKVSSDITEFTVDGVDIEVEEEPSVQVGKKKAEKGFFTGTYTAGTEVPEFNLFLSGNHFWYSTGYTKMKAFRGYFELYDVLTSVEESYSSRISIVFGDGGETTGIQDNKRESINNKHYYDIQGRRINGQSSMGNGQMKKGVYIVNGKKVIK